MRETLHEDLQNFIGFYNPDKTVTSARYKLRHKKQLMEKTTSLCYVRYELMPTKQPT